MANIKQTANEYKEKYKNITELKEISVNVELLDGVGTNKDGEDFVYKYFVDSDDCEVRVPVTVIKQLKEQIENNNKLEKFKVTKKGTGLNTEYTVIPLQ